MSILNLKICSFVKDVKISSCIEQIKTSQKNINLFKMSLTLGKFTFTLCSSLILNSEGNSQI